MSSDLLTPKQRIGRAVNAVPNKRREKNEAALILALMIGAAAAFGIILLADNDPDGTASRGAPTQQLDGQR